MAIGLEWLNGTSLSRFMGNSDLAASLELVPDLISFKWGEYARA